MSDHGTDPEGTDAEHPDAEHPDAEHPDAEHPDAEHPDAEHPDAEATEPAGVDLEGWLKAILRCPACRSTLTQAAGPAGAAELACDGCDLAYPVSDGIPVLLVDEARRR